MKFSLIVLVGMAAIVCGEAQAQTPTPVPQLDLKRLAAQYYEIARLPNKPEKKCIGNAIALYNLGDKPGRLQLVTSCNQNGNFINVRNQDGRRQVKGGTDGKLKLGPFWPLYSKYWVLGLGADYEWALVGTPNHKKLWIYAKTATLRPDVLADIRTSAAAQGYKVDQLIVGRQSGGQSSGQSAATKKPGTQ
jgi:apolipoprotein D and lipocalin family protein